MKKYLLSLFAVLVCASSYGQVIRFTEPTNEWRFRTTTMDGVGTWTQKYTGDTVINGTAYKKCTDGYAYREDTSAKRVYARRVVQQGYIDTIEQTLYDYNLEIGDTLTHYVDTFVIHNIVTGLDSFQLNSHWYKVWQFGGYHNFTVVEGLGCLEGSYEPILVGYWVEDSPHLTCFSTNGINPAINIPSVYPNLPPLFANPADCTLSVNETTQEKNKISIPNPATINSTINIPQAYRNGRMYIYDAMGRKCANISLLGGADVPFANGLTVAGMYYFLITSADNKYSQRGAFIFAP